MADVLNARFGSLVKRVFALKTVDPGAHIGGGIAPSFDVQDEYQPENRALRGEKLCALPFIGTNTNTLFQWATVINAPTSGKLVIVKKIILGFLTPTAAAQGGNLYFAIEPPATSAAEGVGQTLSYQDGRLALGTHQATVGTNLNYTKIAIVAGTQALASLYFWQIQVVAAATQYFQVLDELDIILPPGTLFRFGPAADALATANWPWICSIECIERVVDPSELIAPP